MKWLGVIVLTVIGVLAAVLAVEYLTVAIGHLASIIPGHSSVYVHGHLRRGHYRKYGAVSALVAVAALAGAGYLIYRNIQPKDGDETGNAPSGRAGSTAAPSTTEDLLGGPPKDSPTDAG